MKVLLKISQNSQESTSLFFIRDSAAGVFREFCEISKNTFSYRTFSVATFPT